jgi:hypothetical protein
VLTGHTVCTGKLASRLALARAAPTVPPLAAAAPPALMAMCRPWWVLVAAATGAVARGVRIGGAGLPSAAGGDDDVGVGSSDHFRLRAENAALRAELAAVRAQLRARQQGAAAATGQGSNGAGAGARSCPKAVRQPWTGMPNGTYSRSCSGCVRIADTLRCNGCFRRTDIVPSSVPGLVPGNVSGVWGAGRGVGEKSALLLLRVQELEPGKLSSFTVTCSGGGYTGVCNPRPPGPGGGAQGQWHAGRGVVALQNTSSSSSSSSQHRHHATLLLDTGLRLNGSFDANLSAANWSDGTVCVPLARTHHRICADCCRRCC